MATRTLEEQHKFEREYYLRKTDKIGNKKVSELRAEYRKSKEEYNKKLENFTKEKAPSTLEAETVKSAPISTAVTFGVIDQIKVDPPVVEKDALISNVAQGTGKPVKETVAPDDAGAPPEIVSPPK